MYFRFAILLTFLIRLAAAYDVDFIYNGFRSSNLSLDGIAEFTSNGLLKLTNETKQKKGHAFYPRPVNFKNSTNGSVFSFSTIFVFATISEYLKLSGQGIAFVIAPTRGLPGALPTQFLGLFNWSNNGKDTNHVVAVELDTVQNIEFADINENHVGIDINGLKSDKSFPAGYYEDGTRQFRNLTLISGQRMQVWVEYHGLEKRMDVTLAPINVPKPNTPLLSLSRDLSSILNNEMYVGFSSSTGSVPTSHYVLGWSFKINGQAQELTLSQLPKLPRLEPKKRSRFLTMGLPLILVSLVLAAVSGVAYFIRRKRKFAEVVEDWELEYGPHRFKYKDLYVATKGFKDEELLGAGGFGRVYRGVLPTSKVEIAVKRVSHESRQGMKEFVAEIVSIGRLRHRNLVQLLGYCRRKGELLLVYDYMPNGSLDKYLYDQPNVTLNWRQRFRVIKGVASGLFYLHEEWEQVVIHRDVKASNVLLDGELNGRLGDFGLARLYDHGQDPQTTHIVGTLGYLAPEHARTGKATPLTDVFAFGAFLLEVACGRRPIQAQSPTEDVILIDWVYSCWYKGDILEAKDPKLGTDYVAEEVELVLKLGLLCSHSEPEARPTMRQCVQFFDGDIPFPEISSLSLSSGGLAFAHREGFDDLAMSYTSSIYKGFSRTSSVAESLLSGVAVSVSGVLLLAVVFSAIFFLSRKKGRLTEILEDWEVQLGPHRFPYMDLFVATVGFNEKELLGRGGFGQVYRGELPVSKDQIAVKRIFDKSQQRMKEFLAEIATIGRLRHPNLVRLLGCCRGKDELLLVYDYMPNGSLDKFLHNKPEVTLNWSQRFKIIKDAASAVAYLHEEWLEVIIHRDIKASYVLDDGLNRKLGDFGLARCSKHAKETIHLAGTYGYIAPELAKTGRANTSTDVYAFGAFCLEVVCGRRC